MLDDNFPDSQSIYEITPIQPQNDQQAWGWIIFIIIVALIAVFVAFWPGVAGAEVIQKGKFVDAIIGEAEGEQYRGKLAVACAIRNRGTLNGVCSVGMCSDHKVSRRIIDRTYSSKVFVSSVRAYEESKKYENCLFIEGANHWEGVVFNIPAWSMAMTETVVVGNQRFYKTR